MLDCRPSILLNGKLPLWKIPIQFRCPWTSPALTLAIDRTNNTSRNAACAQTRLPPDLAAVLAGIMDEHDVDIGLLQTGMSDSDPEEAPTIDMLASALSFPAQQLLDAMHDALDVRHPDLCCRQMPNSTNT